MKAVSQPAGQSQEELWVAELESAPEAIELKLQMLPCHPAEKVLLRTEDSPLSASAETPGGERRELRCSLELFGT